MWRVDIDVVSLPPRLPAAFAFAEAALRRGASTTGAPLWPHRGRTSRGGGVDGVRGLCGLAFLVCHAALHRGQGCCTDCIVICVTPSKPGRAPCSACKHGSLEFRFWSIAGTAESQLDSLTRRSMGISKSANKTVVVPELMNFYTSPDIRVNIIVNY